jgi:hypothetical protein
MIVISHANSQAGRRRFDPGRPLQLSFQELFKSFQPFNPIPFVESVPIVQFKSFSRLTNYDSPETQLLRIPDSAGHLF